MNVLLLRFRAVALVGAAAMSLAACGGGSEAKAPSGASPAPPPLERSTEPMTVEEAQDQISRARDELASSTAALQAQPIVPGADAESSRPSHTVPAPEPRPSTPPHSSAKPSAAGKAGRTEDANRCASPCRALTSMRRAVTALCRMTGDADNRCLDAKRTLTDSEGRISPCSC